MAKISKIYAREVLDSRAYPTVEAKVVLDNQFYGVASCPTGVSTSRFESVEIRDNDKERFAGLGVLKAIDNIIKVIQPRLVGVNPEDQEKIDRTLISLDGTANKSKLGVNAVLPVSIACAKAAAASLRKPLYQYLADKFFDSTIRMPTPLFNVINGGKHGAGNLDFQEFFVIPSQTKLYSSGLRLAVEIYFSLKRLLIFKNAIHSVGDEGGFAPNLYTNSDALELLVEAISVTGYHLGQDVFLGLDLAATNFKTGSLYQIKDRSNAISADELIEFYKDLVDRYRLLILEDPLAEDDWDDWAKIVKGVGDRTLIVGDDLLATNPKRVDRALKGSYVNAIIIKPNQIGTLTETVEVIKKANRAGWQTIISHRSGDTTDDFVADLAVATKADYAKFGAPARGERVAKYNRLLEIFYQTATPGNVNQ